MIVRTLTLSAPNGSAVTLGQLDASGGDLYGFTLADCTIDPAPIIINQQNLPLIAGGVVAGGRYGVRTVTLSGFVVGRNADETNALRRELVSVLTDHGEMQFIAARFELEGLERQLEGLLDGSVTFRPAGGHYVAYEATIVCPDPVAKSVVESDAMAGTFPGAVLTNIGDARVFPRVSVTALAGTTVTAFRLGNSTTGQFFEVSGISLTSSGTLLIDMTPGEENVTLNGVSILTKMTVSSRFWHLGPGANNVYIIDQSAPGADNARATLYWFDGWVS